MKGGNKMSEYENEKERLQARKDFEEHEKTVRAEYEFRKRIGAISPNETIEHWKKRMNIK